MKTITRSRATEALAMAAIGDAVLALAMPREHARLWSGGPQWWQDSMESFAEHPGITRGLAAAELGFGLWLAQRVLRH